MLLATFYQQFLILRMNTSQSINTDFTFIIMLSFRFIKFFFSINESFIILIFMMARALIKAFYNQKKHNDCHDYSCFKLYIWSNLLETICFHVYIKVDYEWQVNKYYIQQRKKVEFLPVIIAEWSTQIT
jgi:hypothetical protein